MLRLLLFVVNLFGLLPWWGAVLVLGGLALGLYALAKYLFHRMHSDIVQAITEQGVPLTDALVSVHAIEHSEVPTAPAFDDDPDDDDFDPSIDGNLTEDEADYYWIDATIAPVDPATEWEPSALSLVAFDFEPSEELEATDRVGLLHTIEVLRGREFVTLGEGSVTGPQRLRMLFAVTKELLDVKFGYHFTYFGRVELPAAVAVRS